MSEENEKTEELGVEVAIQVCCLTFGRVFISSAGEDGRVYCNFTECDVDGSTPDFSETVATALREKYGPKPERPASDIDLKAALDVWFGWYGEDDSAIPRSREVLAFFQGRHGFVVPNGGCLTKAFTNSVGNLVPAKIYGSYVPVARRLADDFESLAAQLREIIENSDA